MRFSSDAVRFVLATALLGGRYTNAQTCMGDAGVAAGQVATPTDYTCDSDSVFLEGINLLQFRNSDGDLLPPPFSCADGDQVELLFTVDLRNALAQGQRTADLGIWISNDGDDAKTGSCKHYYFFDDRPIFRNNPNGFLNNLDGTLTPTDQSGQTLDACGDLGGGLDIKSAPLFSSVDNIVSGVTVTCKAGLDDFLLVQYCLGYSARAANDECVGDLVVATLPSAPDQCQCGFMQFGVQVTEQPSSQPSSQPSVHPTAQPSDKPSAPPSSFPSSTPSAFPTAKPTPGKGTKMTTDQKRSKMSSGGKGTDGKGSKMKSSGKGTDGKGSSTRSGGKGTAGSRD